MAKDKSKQKKDKGEESPEVAEARKATGPPRLQAQYRDEVRPKLAEQFGLKNPMSHPKLEKIVINVNLGRHLDGTKVPQAARDTVRSTLETITGQAPVIVHAKRSVANFKVREGYETAMMVTVRRERMWHFLDRLVNLVTPRIKDFQGLARTSFDSAGNYSMGLNEQGVFPEIDMARVSFTHGMHINFVFARSSPEISAFVLEELGFPFKRQQEQKKAG